MSTSGDTFMRRNPWYLVLALLIAAPFAFNERLVGQEAPGSPSPERSRAEWLARSPLRDLPSPEGAQVRGGGGGGGADYDVWNLRVEGDFTAERLLAHYRDALAQRGWTFGTVSVDRNVALVTGRTGEPNPSHVLLMASAGVREPGHLILSLRVTQLAPK